MVLRSSIRRPLERPGTLLPLRIDEDRADYLLRAWPDPACYRRDWGNEHWLEFSPPIEAWAHDRSLWPARGRTRRRDAAGAPQLRLELEAQGAELAPGGLASFWSSIPPELRVLLDRLPTARWPTLIVAAEDERTQELLLQNASLGVLLTDRGLEAALGQKVYQRRQLRERLLGLRQHLALGELGFPARRGFRRLLQRIVPEAVNVRALLELRRAQRLDALEGLPVSHLERLHTGVLALLCDDTARPHLHPRLLHEVAARDQELREAHAVHLLRDSVLMLRTLNRPHQGLCPRGLPELQTMHDELLHDLRLHADALERRRVERERARRAVEQARRNLARNRNRLGQDGRMVTEREIMEAPPLHEVVGPLAEAADGAPGRDVLDGMRPQEPVAPRVERRRAPREVDPDAAAARRRTQRQRWQERWSADVDFGEPPIPETETIRWIRSARELRRAAVRLRNCAMSYRDEMLGGRYALYVITAPEEGMIGLRRTAVTTADGRAIWEVSQIFGDANSRLRPATMRQVREWARANVVAMD